MRPGKAGITYLRPRFHRQFRDLNSSGVNDGHLSTVHVLVVHHLLNGSFKSFVAWKLWDKEDRSNVVETERQRQCSTSRRAGACAHHRQRLVAVQHAADVGHDLSDVVVWDLTGPASANPFGPVD